MLRTKRYGDYKIIDLIGKGGYGNVYLAQKDDIQYAIKCIDKDRIIEENLGDSIKTEIQLMRMIRHPYIVKLANVMTTQQKIILVMEYVSGGDLFDLIVSQPEKRLSEDVSRLYFQQIIMALEYCHSVKIIHRDLKPDNILYDKTSNCIKISDFGLSTLLKHNDEMIQNACGTPNYLAPEVMKQNGYLGQAADIWSAGVILFNMVTGGNPFHHTDQNILLKNILSGNADYPKYLSKSIVDLLSKIFVPQPRNRYTIDQIKEHSWFKVNFKPVIGYLKEQIGEIKQVEEPDGITESPIKEKKLIKTENFIVIIDLIPIINCFELTSMLAGKWISKMFENGDTKQLMIDYDRFSYEFTCDLHYEEFAKIIETYFTKLCKSIHFIDLNLNGKFEIELTFSSSQHMTINLHLYKITEEKLIFSLRLKSGNKTSYLKMMGDFCSENDEHFKLF